RRLWCVTHRLERIPMPLSPSVQPALDVPRASQIAVRRKPLNLWLRDNGAPLLMALPGILILFIFAYLPMFGIIIAFKEYRFDQGILGSKWIGFYNFKYLFS